MSSFGNVARLAITIVIFGSGLICTFVAQSLAFQVLGTRNYGLFSVIYSVCAIASMLGVAGFDVSTLRYFGTLKANLKPHFFNIAMRATVIVSASAAIGILFIGGFLLDTDFLILGLAAAATFLWAFVRLFSAMLRAEGCFNLSLLIDRPVRDGLITLACGLALLSSFKLELFHVLALLVCGGLIGVAAAFPSFRSYRIKTPKIIDDAPQVWRSASFGLLIVNILQLTMNRVDVLWVSFVVNAEMAGILNILITISDMVIIPSSALIIIVMPRIARDYQLGERKKLKRTLLLYSFGSFVGGLFISVPLMLYPSYAIAFFGKEAIGSIGTGELEFLVLTKLVLVAFSCGAPLLMMSGNIRGMVLTFVLLIIAKLAFMPLLVIEFEMKGALYVIGLGAVTLGAVQMFLAWRLIRIYRPKTDLGMYFRDLQKPRG